LSPGESLAIARRVAQGYEKMKDDPRIQAIRARVVEYNQLLRHFAMSDHQVKKLTPNPFRAAFRLFSQLILFIITFTLCVPG
jgi:glycerol-3-phosphate O-acyltransferase/dihydroxyacetone phosphate acyltransferase